MKNKRLPLLLTLSVLLAACTTQPTTPPPPLATAAQPQPKPPGTHEDASAATPKANNQVFFTLHESFLARGKEGPIGVLFLGDSITRGWDKAPGVWKKYYGAYQPANFGIGGDRTQHVIWRIANGELDGINPKLVVLMLGTNNTGSNTAAEIVAADTKIIKMIQEKIPGTKVLLLAIFPRGPKKNKEGVVVDDAVARMAIIKEANRGLAKLDNGRTVRFLDIGAKFLNREGKIPDAIMPDQLHPNAAGYAIWAEAMHPLFTEMMR